MKHLLTNYPFRTGLAVLILYGVLDYTDAKYFLPHRGNNYKACERSEQCREWLQGTKPEDYVTTRSGIRVPKEGEQP